jgi:3-dehydroquinate synthase
VTAAGGAYPVFVGAGLGPLARAVASAHSSRVALVTDAAVWRFHGERIARSLAAFGPAVIRIPRGERGKTADTVRRIYRGLLGAGCDRESLVVAAGGGVVGDLAGFAAATFYRGVPWVAVPTTLLAQVDAAIGGKTGYDLPEGKNLVGAFHPPRAVVADAAFLATLPTREVRAALAEVIKAGMVADARLLEAVDRSAPRLVAGDARALRPIVDSAARIKAEIVSTDERETGLRRKLNFGHTVGHALEAATGYAKFLHGEAVAAGMVVETALGVELGITPAAVLVRLRALLARVGLTDNLDKFRLHAVADRIHYDKKRSGDDIRLILPDAWGSVTECRVPRYGLVRYLMRADAVTLWKEGV